LNDSLISNHQLPVLTRIIGIETVYGKRSHRRPEAGCKKFISRVVGIKTQKGELKRVKQKRKNPYARVVGIETPLLSKLPVQYQRKNPYPRVVGIETHPNLQ